MKKTTRGSRSVEQDNERGSELPSETETEKATEAEGKRSVRLLDLYCGEGGAAVGYHRAGFSDIVGIDIKPQPRYPFAFIQADALRPPLDLSRFDLIHASPPCQAHTSLKAITKQEYPDFIEATRRMLEASGVLYVIENVPGSPLFMPIMLCGKSFGLKVYRHRLFESPALALQPNHEAHDDNCRIRKGISRNGFISVAGDGGFGCGPGGLAYARKAMGIDWTSRAGLSQAIPPAYTEWVGRQLLGVL